MTDKKYIVSFTSYGPRIEMACKMIYSLMLQTYKDFQIVMTLYKDDVQYIGPKMQLLIDVGLVELIIADENLKSHLKYFYAMKRYWDRPIITVDDDRRYAPDTIEHLVSAHEQLANRNEKIVICNWGMKINKKNDRLMYPMTQWPQLRFGEISKLGVAEGFAGVLYPPKCFNDLDSELPLIRSCLRDDDLVLKIIGIKNRITVYRTHCFIGNPQAANIQETQQYNLHNTVNTWNARNGYVSQFNDLLLEGFKW